jgi:hypothetical protein
MQPFYIDEVGCTIEECTKEHQRDIGLYRLECSVVAEHSIHQGHWMQFDNSVALMKLPHYTSWAIHEANENSLQDNFSREGGYQ